MIDGDINFTSAIWRLWWWAKQLISRRIFVDIPGQMGTHHLIFALAFVTFILSHGFAKPGELSNMREKYIHTGFDSPNTSSSSKIYHKSKQISTSLIPPLCILERRLKSLLSSPGNREDWDISKHTQDSLRTLSNGCSD